MRSVASAALVSRLLAESSIHAVGPPGMPPPGQYRIDAETTTTSRAGPTTLESVHRTDGATGRVTLTQKSSVDPANVAAQTVNGTGPNRWCVPAAGTVPPVKSAQGACQNALRAATPTGSILGADCIVGRVEEQWRRIDDRTWERSSTVRQAPGASTVANSSPQAAIELAMRGTTPAQRASAQAELVAMPSAADMADTRGTLIAMLETQTHGAYADEAAVARKQFKNAGRGPRRIDRRRRARHGALEPHRRDLLRRQLTAGAVRRRQPQPGVRPVRHPAGHQPPPRDAQ